MGHPLLELVEKHFADEFLFNPSHKHWLDILSKNEGWVDLTALSSFVDLANACAFDVAGKITPLLADSTVLETRTPENSDRVQVRRKQPIDAGASPDARTIFTKPIHTDATNEQIQAFFEKFGPVASVDRRYFAHLDPETKTVRQKARPSCFVVFATVEGANACLAAKPSYGALPDQLGNLFVPRLTVATKGSYEQRMSDVAEKDHQQVQRKNLMGVAQTDKGAPDGPRPKMMQAGACLKATGLAAGTAWTDVKCRLGNLCVNEPQLKNAIVQCKEEDGGKTCYLIMRNPAAANLLVTTFSVAISATTGTEGFLNKMKELREKIPTLVKVEGDEEVRIMKEYPTWTGGQPTKKRTRGPPS